VHATHVVFIFYKQNKREELVMNLMQREKAVY